MKFYWDSTVELVAGDTGNSNGTYLPLAITDLTGITHDITKQGGNLPFALTSKLVV